MPEITLSRIGTLLRGVLELLWNKPEGMPANDILASLPQLIHLTDYERGYSASANAPRYERIVRLATFPLVRVGWISKSNNGHWHLTEEGRQACRKFPNVQEFYKEAIRLLDEAQQNSISYLVVAEEAQEKAWEQIRRFLLEIHKHEFQELLADLLTALGYHLGWSAPPEKSRGQVDMVVNVDPVGVKGTRILVQIRHKNQAVSLEGLESFLTMLGPTDHGLLVSSGGFTPDVKDEIQNDAFQRLTIWDLENFYDLWLRYYDRLSQEARERLPLKAIYFLYHTGRH